MATVNCLLVRLRWDRRQCEASTTWWRFLSDAHVMEEISKRPCSKAFEPYKACKFNKQNHWHQRWYSRHEVMNCWLNSVLLRKPRQWTHVTLTYLRFNHQKQKDKLLHYQEIIQPLERLKSKYFCSALSWWCSLRKPSLKPNLWLYSQQNQNPKFLKIIWKRQIYKIKQEI